MPSKDTIDNFFRSYWGVLLSIVFLVGTWATLQYRLAAAEKNIVELTIQVREEPKGRETLKTDIHEVQKTLVRIESTMQYQASAIARIERSIEISNDRPSNNPR